jgi:hypothetical protein
MNCEFKQGLRGHRRFNWEWGLISGRKSHDGYLRDWHEYGQRVHRLLVKYNCVDPHKAAVIYLELEQFSERPSRCRVAEHGPAALPIHVAVSCGEFRRARAYGDREHSRGRRRDFLGL